MTVFPLVEASIWPFFFLLNRFTLNVDSFGISFIMFVRNGLRKTDGQADRQAVHVSLVSLGTKLKAN